MLLGHFIELSVPRVRVVKATDAGDALREMTGIHDNVTAVRQGFRSDIKGEAIVLCRTASIARLMSVVDRTFGDGVYGGMATPDEVVFDVANVLMGACVASILDRPQARVLSAGAARRERVVRRRIPADRAGMERGIAAGSELRAEDHAFRAHFVMLMAEDSIRLMGDALDALLSAL